VDALARELTLPAQIIVVVRVATVDHHVVATQERSQLLERRIDQGSRYHDPHGARSFELRHQICERARCDRAMLRERSSGARVHVVDDALLFSTQQAPNHVRAHAAQTDHSDFHVKPPAA
jgi:hypothetical protein